MTQKYENCAVLKKKRKYIWWITEKQLPLHPQIRHPWSLRLSVRTRDFHSLKRSSTLLGTTIKTTRNKESIKMANHKSSVKRIRQDKKRTLHNKYYAKTMRNAVRKLRAITDKEEALKLYPSVQKMLDKLAKTNLIHKNKAANLKSSLSCYINKLG